MEITSMKKTNQNRPFVIWVLLACLVFLSIGGLVGAGPFVTDPSGAIMGMNVGMLKPLPLRDFMLPGLFLLVVYSLGSMVAVYGIWMRRRWAWYATCGISLVLLGWLAGEMLILQLFAPITTICMFDGIAMLGLCVLPSVRQYCSIVTPMDPALS